MSWTNGKPFIATEEDCKFQWNGGKNGKYFRCALCGHRFVPGDVVRWQYTNDTPGAGGNPFVCKPCDGPKEYIVKEILARREEMKTRMWWFARNGQ